MITSISTSGLDMDSKRILNSTQNRPMTINQLSTYLNIPVAICAKKVARLKFKGLLKRTVQLDEEDKPIVFYQRAEPSEKVPAKIKGFPDKISVEAEASGS